MLQLYYQLPKNQAITTTNLATKNNFRFNAKSKYGKIASKKVMSGKNDEPSAFEMETRENFNKILQAINDLRQDFSQRSDKIEPRLNKIETRLDKIEAEQAEIRKEFDEFKSYLEAQFEAVCQGLVKNYNQFDRLVPEISQNRFVIYSTKAEVGELHEQFFRLTGSGKQALK